jgi:hypothetical protein
MKHNRLFTVYLQFHLKAAKRCQCEDLSTTKLLAALIPSGDSMRVFPTL